jgi:SAM-dependent methyltransferase
MTIEAHSALAPFYAGRPPYTPVFFEKAALKLGLSGESILMDLCCGRGELSAGFAPRCKSIYAIDGSREMLDHRIPQPNVDYRLYDVNKDVVALPQPVDHVVIGSAIHWLEPASLGRLIERNLQPGGKVLVTHTLMKTQQQPWYSALAKLDASYGKDGAGAKSYKDLEGADRLKACGFERVDNLRVVRSVTFNPSYLYKMQLSYLYSGFHEQVSKDLEGYRRKLGEAVKPYLDAEGKLRGELVNWGVVFGNVAGAS